MLVRIRLNFRHPSSTSPASTPPPALSLRERFWKEYWQLAGQPDENADSGEKLIHKNFTTMLKELLQQGRERSFTSKLAGRGKLDINLITIEYGTIELLLNILGVDSGIMQQMLLAALVAYSPIAFNRSTNTHPSVAMTAEVDLISSPVESAQGMKPLALLGSSLLVPVLLALAVLYFAFSALTEAHKQAHQESENAKDRALKLVEAQMVENAKLSSSLAQTANGTMILLKELHKQLIGKGQRASLPEPPSVTPGSGTTPKGEAK
jgi:hypothetical protein